MKKKKTKKKNNNNKYQHMIMYYYLIHNINIMIQFYKSVRFGKQAMSLILTLVREYL